jgi:serine/threonine protein kinase
LQVCINGYTRLVTKAPDRVGQLISERYELLEVIGRGGQGTVYRARDRWSPRRVAVKILGSKAAREPHVVERLMREQQAMIVLKGTSAVELFDVCRGNEGELCLVMELLTGTRSNNGASTCPCRAWRRSSIRS